MDSKIINIFRSKSKEKEKETKEVNKENPYIFSGKTPEELQDLLKDRLNMSEKLTSISPEKMIANFKNLNINEQKVLLNALSGAIKHYVLIRYRKEGFKFFLSFLNNLPEEVNRLFENINLDLLGNPSDVVADLWAKIKK